MYYSDLGTRAIVCHCPPICTCAHEDKPPLWTERRYEWNPETRKRTNRIVREGVAWSPKRRFSEHHIGCTAPLQDHSPNCPNAYCKDSEAASWWAALMMAFQKISFTHLDFEVPALPQLLKEEI